MKLLLTAVTLVLAFSVASQAQSISLNEIMSNSPETHEKVNGLKDFRVVIPGVLYRGGNSGGGQIALKDIGLHALAEKGFSGAYYMYSAGWSSRPSNPHIEYSTLSGAFKDRAAIKKYLSKVRDIIVNKKGPMYVHCWNGWHASGEFATYALMQFCGLNNQQGQAYWNANVPRGDANKIMRMSRFQVFQDEDLQISSEDRNRICPR
jgi:hypothetical protein